MAQPQIEVPSFRTSTLPMWEIHNALHNWYRTMRDEHPIFYDEEHRVWHIFRYEDVQYVLTDYTTFSSETFVHSDRSQSASIISMDPPRHRQLRSLVTQAFSARTIAQMAPRIAVIANDLLDKVVIRGEMDMVADLAVPLPVMVIAELLGVPREDWMRFKAWTDILLKVSSNPQIMQERREEMQALGAYFWQALEERKRQPRQDVLSLLIAAEVDGQHLSNSELMGFCITLLVAGNITTTNLLGNAILCFDRFAQIEHLHQHPELLPGAIEEALRYLPPFVEATNEVTNGRLTTEDVVVGDQHIPKGEMVRTSLVSANFDERQFPDPQHFSIERNPNRHLSFGHGIHFCLGAPLARLEAKVVFELMLKRLPGLRVKADQPLEQGWSSIMFGPRQVLLTFQAGEE